MWGKLNAVGAVCAGATHAASSTLGGTAAPVDLHQQSSNPLTCLAVQGVEGGDDGLGQAVHHDVAQVGHEAAGGWREAEGRQRSRVTRQDSSRQGLVRSLLHPAFCTALTSDSGVACVWCHSSTHATHLRQAGAALLTLSVRLSAASCLAISLPPSEQGERRGTGGR